MNLVRPIDLDFLRPVRRAPAAAARGRLRLPVCRECEHYNGTLCERAFPRGVCLTGWTAWLDMANARCPEGRW